ncbi:MAG: zinc ribbon domain-containing protein [Clostridia bacterium]|nr:zinc ribbon domain-containing protein [Clostridia bacterium]
MSRGSSSISGGGGFSGGSSHSGGGYHSSGNGGLFTGLLIGSLLSRRSGGSSGDSSGENNSDGIKYKKVRNQRATLIVSGVFLAITVLFVVLSIVFRFSAVYDTISATATDYDYRYDYDQGRSYYYTTYEFTYGGRDYSIESKIGWTKLENMEGKTYTEENINTYYLHKNYEIFVKKSNPFEIYEVEAKGDMPSTNLIYIFFAIFFGIVTVIVYLAGINKYEIDQEYLAEKKKMEEEKMPEGKRKCGYCGGIIDASSNKCPHCGASTK